MTQQRARHTVCSHPRTPPWTQAQAQSSALPLHKLAPCGLDPICLLCSLGWDPVFQESPADTVFWAPNWDPPIN